MIIISFAFYDEDDFVGFASVLYNAKSFLCEFLLPSYLKCGVMATEVRLLINWWTLWTIAVYGLGSRALDEPNDNPEQRAARWDFYKRNGFKTSNAFWNMKV